MVNEETIRKTLYSLFVKIMDTAVRNNIHL